MTTRTGKMTREPLYPKDHYRVLGTGVPRLACLRPAAWLKWLPSTAHLRQLKLKTLAGAKPREADDERPPQEWPHHAGSRGGGEIKAGVSREIPMTQAMTIETRRAPGGCRPVQCPCFLFGAKGASTGVEYRGIRQRFPFQCNETKSCRAAGWRSPWSPRRRHRQCLWQPKTNFSQVNLY